MKIIMAHNQNSLSYGLQATCNITSLDHNVLNSFYNGFRYISKLVTCFVKHANAQFIYVIRLYIYIYYMKLLQQVSTLHIVLNVINSMLVMDIHAVPKLKMCLSIVYIFLIALEDGWGNMMLILKRRGISLYGHLHNLYGLHQVLKITLYIRMCLKCYYVHCH